MNDPQQKAPAPGANGPPARKRQLTHAQFYRACEALKAIKQIVLTERPGLTETAAMLTRFFAEQAAKGKGEPLDVTRHSVPDIKIATGIAWVGKRADEDGPRRKNVYGNQIKTLCRAVYLLYRKLGEEPTEGLARMYAELNAQAHPEQQPRS